MMKPALYSNPSLEVSDPSGDLLSFPDFSEQTCRLMESPAPSFEQQLAHAAMLLRWKAARGLPDDRVPGNPEPFEL